MKAPEVHDEVKPDNGLKAMWWYDGQFLLYASFLLYAISLQPLLEI